MIWKRCRSSTYGSNAARRAIEAAGDCEGKLAIENGSAVLSWSRGLQTVKSVPSEVKANNAEMLAELKKAAKELQGVLSTQRLRLERQLLSQSSCRFDRWKAWYLDIRSRRCSRAAHLGNRERRARRRRLSGGKEDSPRLGRTSRHARAHFHRPAVAPDPRSGPGILSWRCWLEDRGIRQPFKQAHREVYLLTDAERQTDTYSNRFASHIVRQHQFAALCRERGWQFNLMGEWDSHNTPYLDLPQYNLRAEFRRGVFGGRRNLRSRRVSNHPHGPRSVFPHRNRSRRRFEIRPRVPSHLADISPVVFSEVMRDVDLLVGVTSIGADPTWGVERTDPHAEYWLRFADAELSIAAENRKAVLASLLPKLTIRDRCRLEGRYLMVRGESNEYRIHLGSGNVIMEPGAAISALCGVPAIRRRGFRCPLRETRCWR